LPGLPGSKGVKGETAVADSRPGRQGNHLDSRQWIPLMWNA